MTLKRIYICDICGKETEQESLILSGYIQLNIMVGNLAYWQGVKENSHTCKSCLDIIYKNVKETFQNTVSKLRIE